MVKCSETWPAGGLAPREVFPHHARHERETLEEEREKGICRSRPCGSHFDSNLGSRDCDAICAHRLD
jgi:hypothetical protein